MPTEKTPYLIWKGSEAWVAKDVRTGVASQGETRQEALENLDEAISLHEGEGSESIETWEEEREFLKELGIDPEEVKRARKSSQELPEFMQ
ncbi:hypothetical protein AKJ47_01195 [candidate division MSBL1 archaeon SCGC-AAA261G05]|uniref:HicB-like antitoxin of toxin-antitoxin system domain-containing protein n=3 Tax=candidate division MSBL1 TaxID=215777 RepID=A0A133V0D5_9EURY|nr:hypothetical protein AKJ42_02290 [candidate division MSBL1 archaeon SCGC-AAA261C02]KXB04003.1 hypothetical protein AKJ47_01195 [candidate division MSBL1 archaeon SCGC-AAA261G05]KXB04858.1 hypothetical protein AKJ48_01190 [candidate division MSBL1 archaeon SCGC-AAA261O19]